MPTRTLFRSYDESLNRESEDNYGTKVSCRIIAAQPVETLTVVPVWVTPYVPVSFANPKSSTFTVPVLATSKLAGLMSRCTMPARPVPT